MRPIHSSILAIAAILVATAPALAESKVSQCQRVQINAQKIEAQMRPILQKTGGDQTERFGQLLKGIENAAKQVRATQFQDPTLKALQQRSAELYEQDHDDLVDAYDASVHHDQAALQRALQALKKRNSEYSALNQAFSRYCRPTP